MAKRMSVLLITIALGLAEVALSDEPPVPLPDSRFGIDYVFAFDPEYRSDQLARTISDIGAGWVNVANVAWSEIEASPPRLGRHRYRWSDLDDVVRTWQRYGARLTMSLAMRTGWFSGPANYQSALDGFLPQLAMQHADRLPAADYEQSYRDWIEALVERYDGDGLDDMPGLQRPILHFQIGNEYSNPMFWLGTIDDYRKLLGLARVAAKTACAEAMIISNGIRWNDLFTGDPQADRFDDVFSSFLRQEPDEQLRGEWRRHLEFTRATVLAYDVYDILDAGGNGPYPNASAGYMMWVKQLLGQPGCRTSIWDMEARCEPILIKLPGTFHPELAVPSGELLLAAMKSRHGSYHRLATAWYRAEQARELVKVFVKRFAAGFEKVFMGMPKDWDRSLGALSTRNPFLGLTDSKNTPWPAHRAMALLVRELDGFTAVRQVRTGPRVELFEFSFADRNPTWVAWRSDPTTRGLHDPLPQLAVTLPIGAGRWRLTRTPVSDEDGAWEHRESTEQGLSLSLDATPVIISRQATG